MINFVTAWGTVVSIKDRETLLENNINYILGGYENGMSDDPDEFPRLTEEEVIDMCIPEIYDQISDGNGYTMFGEGIARELKFLGNDLIHQKILEIARDSDILKEGKMKVELEFDDGWLEYLRKKFEINDEEDLKEAIFECINTYMEM